MAKESFWQRLKEAGNKLLSWVKGLFVKNDAFAKKYAPIAINVVNWIKNFNESEGADMVEVILTKLTGKYGKAAGVFLPAVRTWLKKDLPMILDSLNLVNAVANADGVQAKAIVARDALNSMTDLDAKAEKWVKITRDLANYLANDGRLSFNEAMAIIITVYETYSNESDKLN